MKRDLSFLDEICAKLILIYEYQEVSEKRFLYQSAYQIHKNGLNNSKDLPKEEKIQNFCNIFQPSKLERTCNGCYCYSPMNTSFSNIYETFCHLNRSFPTTDILNSLGWFEYEKLLTLILDEAGFFSIHTFRFKSSPNRFEIDIIARKGSVIFVIDAKRWKSATIAPMKLEEAAERQVYRAKKLILNESALSRLKKRLHIQNSRNQLRSYILIPLIIVSNNFTMNFLAKGIPVIEFVKFEDLLANYSILTNSYYNIPFFEINC